MPADARRVRDLFLAAAEMPVAERAAYLTAHCGDDAELQTAVERLLAAHEQPASILVRPAPGIPTAADYAPITEKPGTMVGPYKLLQQIGEGGMGVVYMAEQLEPVRRKVALKVIKPGMDSAQVIARFEAERQALAMMDHQNIARVLDAGTTESGRPYFVMELVHGVPITQFCDDHQLTPRERLALFVPVCQALQHAHQKGIIHRDVKPSNVLVTMYDDKPVPKVIDFGVAKAIEQRLTERTLFTQFGALVGTFEYISPEQAEMNAFGVDTRSDVYSLGVLLYELLTGTTPLERTRLRTAALDEMVRLIKEEDAPRPSVRLSTCQNLPKIAAARKTEPAQLSKLVRGEIDWIVMKCLEKDRSRRYDTASGLARDVERHLADEPVEACPPSAGYRLRKFTRKHKRPLITASAFLLLLVAGAALSFWQAVRATLAEAAAIADRDDKEIALQAEAKQRGAAVGAREDLRRTLYASSLNLAQSAAEAGEFAQVNEILEELRPKQGEEDLRGFEWHYWRRQGNSEAKAVQLPMKHDSRLIFSPGGGLLAAWLPPNRWQLFDTARGEPVASVSAASFASASFAFSPDGKILAAEAYPAKEHNPDRQKPADTRICLFDTATGQEGVRLKNAEQKDYVRRKGEDPTPFEPRETPLPLIFSPDGKRIAGIVRQQGFFLRIWDTSNGAERSNLPLPELDSTYASLCFSPDGTQLALAAYDVEEETWLAIVDAATAKEQRRIVTDHYITRLVFSPDGQTLFGAIGSQGIRGWDLKTGKQRLVIHGPQAGIDHVKSSDGNILAGWNSEDARVYLWDAVTGKPRLGINGHTTSIIDAEFTADSTRLLVAQQDGLLKWWDLTSAPLTGAALAFPFPASTNVESIHTRPIPSAVAVFHSSSQPGEPERRMHLFGVGVALEPPLLAVLDLPKAENGWDAFHGAWEKPGVIRVLSTGGRSPTSLALAGAPVRPGGAAFSPDGRRLAALSKNLTDAKNGPGALWLQIWDLLTGAELHRIAAPLQFSWSPDGKRLAVLRADGLSVLDAATGREVVRAAEVSGVRHWTEGVENLHFSADGKRLAACGRGAFVWDALTGARVLEEAHPGGGWTGGALSPDSKRLALVRAAPPGLVEERQTIELWDVDSSRPLRVIKAPRWTTSLQFSPDGKRLLLTHDGPVFMTVWDAGAGRMLLTLSDRHADFMGVRFSADGQRLLALRYQTGAIVEWSAAPLPPGVEARLRVDSLKNQVPARAELMELLHTDPHLDSAARKAAIALAEKLEESPESLNTASWAIVLHPNRSQEEYRLALARALTAVELEPKNGNILNTLGAAQYRNEMYREALATLKRSDILNLGKQAADHAFLAMTHHRLGSDGEARRCLELCRQTARNREMRLLLIEAESLLARPGKN